MALNANSENTAYELGQSSDFSRLTILEAQPLPEICVICLDRLSEKTIAHPCQHDQFDFSCLGTWLQQRRQCPLCKEEVTGLEYDLDKKDRKFFNLPGDDLPPLPTTDFRERRFQNYRRSRDPREQEVHHVDQGLKEKNLTFRRHVYRNQLYSLYMGSNRISRYRNITPIAFEKNEQLVQRARKWIRRELLVFEFLNPDSASFGTIDRRASNAEYLLEYIIAILRCIDLKGSAGQAEELLKDYLGRQNARLFLHELEAWLRSPYEHLNDWDVAIQYAENSQA